MTIKTDMDRVFLAAKAKRLLTDENEAFWRMSFGAIRALAACLERNSPTYDGNPEAYRGLDIVPAVHIDGWELVL